MEHKTKEFANIVIRYIEKGYSFDQLRDGDDLYEATREEKDFCVDLMQECKEIGLRAFKKKYLSVKEVKDTWTITTELTVFAGDMEKENVISNAEELLENLLDGTDFVSFSVIDAERD